MTAGASDAPLLRAINLIKRTRRASFTRLLRSSFAQFGDGSSVAPPLDVMRAKEIAIGRGTVLGPSCILRVLGEPHGDAKIVIGDAVSIVGWCAISAVARVEIGAGALFARGVYIADHTHAFEDSARWVKDQGLRNVAPVHIGEGAWLGENVIVGPGVEVGRGAVISANSVVRASVPAHSLAAGSPARVIRSWAETPEQRRVSGQG